MNHFKVIKWLFFKLVSEKHDFSFFNNYSLSGWWFYMKKRKVWGTWSFREGYFNRTLSMYSSWIRHLLHFLRSQKTKRQRLMIWCGQMIFLSKVLKWQKILHFVKIFTEIFYPCIKLFEGISSLHWLILGFLYAFFVQWSVLATS